MTEFKSPTAYPVFYRTYSRFIDGKRETWEQVCRRISDGLAELGQCDTTSIYESQLKLHSIVSGRLLWVGGTEWSKIPENFPGSYNCSSTNIDSINAIVSTMNLAMMGCGTGANLEWKHVSKLPPVRRRVRLTVASKRDIPKEARQQSTKVLTDGQSFKIVVGDSRKGWTDALGALLEIASSPAYTSAYVGVVLDVSHLRPAGERLKGFGGKANPIGFTPMMRAVAAQLDKAVGRQLSSLECCKIIDLASMAVVVGNIRRSAGIRQFDSWDSKASAAKQDLWQNSEGVWSIDPDKEMLVMANHTTVYHTKPTLQQCIDSVASQYRCGEGAIMWAGEAVARASLDVLGTDDLRKSFLEKYSHSRSQAEELLLSYCSEDEARERMSRYGLNPCGEIVLSNNFCNLGEVHLNMIDPTDFASQSKAFEAAALSVAILLKHKFTDDRYQASREADPIVGVSFTGLFDFFVAAFGVEWLEWWQAGRPVAGDKFSASEQMYLSMWKKTATDAVHRYCDEAGLRRPNRCTTVQPAGSKSLLTGASCGFHPPKSQQYIRRITFAKDDPVALACIDFGYAVVPSQQDKDSNGVLLNDPFDPRCTAWLVEIPVEVPWADLPGADQIDISKFSAPAQFNFAMQVQNYYVTHNLSATIELREDEINSLATAIYENIQQDGGYVSSAILPRADDLQVFPRMPFEPVDRATYLRLSEQVLQRRKRSFEEALNLYDSIEAGEALQGAAGCDSDKCLLA